MKEPLLPNRVKHIQGLYTRDKSDLFIDDLTSYELRKIANHKEWYERKKLNKIICDVCGSSYCCNCDDN